MSYTVKVTEGDKTVYEYTGNIIIVGQYVELEDKSKHGSLVGHFIDECEASELVAVLLALENNKKYLFGKYPRLGKMYTEALIKEITSDGGVEQYDITKLVDLAKERRDD